MVSWGTSTNDLNTSECIAQQFNNKIYLGNFLLNNVSSDSSFMNLPYLLEFSTNKLTIYTINQSSNSFVLGIDLYEDNSTNIVLRDPLGNPVTYGEYDIVSLLTSSGKTVQYYKLPDLNENEQDSILISKDGIWEKIDFPNSDWNATDGLTYIKNKPNNLATHEWVYEKIQQHPKSDWLEENADSPSYIQNKPNDLATHTWVQQQIQQHPRSDWNETEDLPTKIINMPDVFRHSGEIEENSKQILIDTPEGWIKQDVPELIMTVTFEDETVKSYSIPGLEIVL